MRSLAITLALSLVTAGCAAMIDTAYYRSDRHYEKHVDESSGLPQSVERVEYAVQSQPDGSASLACYQRTRQVERRWRVTKRYRRGGGYSKGTYVAAGVIDVLFGGLVAGVMAGFCTNDEQDVSCWNVLWASPYAVDLVYAIIRNRTIGQDVLVDKSSGLDQLAYGDSPVAEAEIGCEGVAALRVGRASGVSDYDELQGESNIRPRLHDGALTVILHDDDRIELPVATAERWANDRSLDLYATDAAGTPSRVTADRCELIRPLQTQLTPDTQKRYRADCTPTPPTRRTGT